MEKKTLPPFIPGIDLSRMFFQQVVKPLLDEHFPGLKYSAGILGEGSDVLRFDTPQSMDHNWGPHARIFLTEKDFKNKRTDIDQMLRDKLPLEFMGFPTNFTEPNEDTYLVSQMKFTKRHPVNHAIQFYTVKSFFGHYLGFDPYQDITDKDWLLFPQQALLEVTAGEVFYDGLEELEAMREKFRYYPDDVWRYIYAVQWDKIANEESFMGRTAEAGDQLGSSIIATSIVTNIMRICFLMEKKYVPYTKWFGTSFSRLKCAPELTHLLWSIVSEQDWQKREELLGKAYEIVARRHNELGITRKMGTSVVNGDRPYKIIWAHDFYEEIAKDFSPFFRDLKFKLGGIDQFINHGKVTRMDYIWREPELSSIVR